jgi:hypothetical protein
VVKDYPPRGPYGRMVMGTTISLVYFGVGFLHVEGTIYSVVANTPDNVGWRARAKMVLFKPALFLASKERRCYTIKGVRIILVLDVRFILISRRGLIGRTWLRIAAVTRMECQMGPERSISTA